MFSNDPVNILIFLSPDSAKLNFAIAEIEVQPSIVIYTCFGTRAAMYIVLIPKDVPNSIISGLPNSAARFDSKTPYFKGTAEYLAIYDTFLKFGFKRFCP